MISITTDLFKVSVLKKQVTLKQKEKTQQQCPHNLSKQGQIQNPCQIQ